MKVYYINLNKSTERRERTENILKQINLIPIRISAFDGSLLKADSKIIYSNLVKIREDLNKTLSCCISHLEAVKKFHESEDELAIICEDDICLDYQKYWDVSIDDVINDAPEDWEILQLSLTTNSTDFDSIYSKLRPLSSAVCYVINKKGSANIMKLYNFENEKWDVSKFGERCESDYCLYVQTKTYIYHRPMFTYPDINDSTIHNNDLHLQIRCKNLIMKYLSNPRKMYWILNLRNDEKIMKICKKLKELNAEKFKKVLIYDSEDGKIVHLLLREKLIDENTLIHLVNVKKTYVTNNLYNFNYRIINPNMLKQYDLIITNKYIENMDKHLVKDKTLIVLDEMI